MSAVLFREGKRVERLVCRYDQPDGCDYRVTFVVDGIPRYSVSGFGRLEWAQEYARLERSAILRELARIDGLVAPASNTGRLLTSCHNRCYPTF